MIEDFVSPELTELLEQMVHRYTDVKPVRTACGYACSEFVLSYTMALDSSHVSAYFGHSHASFTKIGVPSAFVIEATWVQLLLSLRLSLIHEPPHLQVRGVSLPSPVLKLAYLAQSSNTGNIHSTRDKYTVDGFSFDHMVGFVNLLPCALDSFDLAQARFARMSIAFANELSA